MKKKRKFRFLSFLFGLMIFSMPILFAGCGGFSLNGSDESQLSLGGVKVLSRPTDYSFKEAVGEFSENYYNIFAKHILENLYYVYEYQEDKFSELNQRGVFDGIVTTDSTYTNISEDDKYYLYDSLRYTITSVGKTLDSGDEITKEILTLDLNSKWKWTIQNDAIGRSVFFKNISEDLGSEKVAFSDNSVIFKSEYFDEFSTWYYRYRNSEMIPSFPEVYTATDGEVKIDGSEQTNYFKSPYYAPAENLENYFQDALEYAIYMIVMGYEFEVDNGTILNTKDFDFFDFEIIKDADGKISNIKVGGWENSKIGITQALKKAKDRYDEVGNYVGITGQNDEGLPNNEEDIVNFVKYFVIGKNALAKDTFEVTFTTKKDGEDDIVTTEHFNRNYDTIIKNIVKYACSQAPIGKDGEENPITLDKSYTFSKISDFSGDYFFLNYEDENGNNNADNLFARVEAAEYQSFVIFPLEQDFGKTLTDIWLAFEYKDYGIEGLEADDEIAINIGIRYFDCEANGGVGQITEVAPTRKVIKNGDLYAEEFEGQNWFYISTSDEGMSEKDDYIVMPEILKLRQFNNNIGGGAINPNASGSEENLSSIYITGAGETKEYYKMNKSSSYGYYATLNEKMFSKNNAGDDACNFIEIYFDIEKNKAKTGVSYNFKTGLVLTYINDEI